MLGVLPYSRCFHLRFIEGFHSPSSGQQYIQYFSAEGRVTDIAGGRVLGGVAKKSLARRPCTSSSASTCRPTHCSHPSGSPDHVAYLADVVPSTGWCPHTLQGGQEAGCQIECRLLSTTACRSGEDWTQCTSRKVYTTRFMLSACKRE